MAASGGAGGPTLLRKAHVQLARALDVPREVELQRAVTHAYACRRAGREVGHAGVGEYATWLGLGVGLGLGLGRVRVGARLRLGSGLLSGSGLLLGLGLRLGRRLGFGLTSGRVDEERERDGLACLGDGQLELERAFDGGERLVRG